MTGIQWTICVVAAIGFTFDIYALLMLPLIARPALMELGHLKPGSPEFRFWLGLLFWVPAMAGGVFGLLGGYLTDFLGRRRVLTYSILLYSVATAASAFATSLEQLLFFRTLTFVGVCVEFVAAVAWLAELFDVPKQREGVLGTTQAFSSFGGILVATVNRLAVQYGPTLPAIYGGHSEWRYTLLSGLLPAIPLMIVRPFLPESPKWLAARGTLKRPSVAELFAPRYVKSTVVVTLMYALAYAVAFGAIQQLPQIVPGLPEVVGLKAPQQQSITAAVQSMQETGGLVGRVIFAMLAVMIASRRTLLRIFQVPALFIVPFVFLVPAVTSLSMLKIGIFVAGLVTVAQFSFWGNYLPLIYPTHLRGTGEGFAANVGGRMLGTSFAFVCTQLSGVMPAVTDPGRMAQAAAGVAGFVLLVAFGLSFVMPEPGDKLPE